MMQAGFQASTSFLSHCVPWGEWSSWYSLIVCACRAGARLWNNGSHWWECMALHMPKPTHIAVGRQERQQGGITRWGFRIENGLLLPTEWTTARLESWRPVIFWKALSVSLDRHVSSEALISWQMHLFLVSSKNREHSNLNVENYTHFIFKEGITGEPSFLQKRKQNPETYLDLF